VTYNPAIHHRRSIRLKGYDYTQCGAYFITIVTQGRECLFGRVINGNMQLNDAGQMVARWWEELANKYPHIIPDAAIVMPNHFHGIIVITDGPIDDDGDVGADLRVRPCTDADHDQGTHTDVPLRVRPNTYAHDKMGAHTGAPLRSTDAGVSQIVQWFKTMTTNEYIRGVKTLGWTPFPGKLWQRNYYEHIIRDENAHHRIRHYIINNPAQWNADNENPEKVTR
jgi:putative transposase